MFPFLFTKEITDQWTQENFLRVQDFFKAFPFIKGEFKFFEIVETAAVTNHEFPHNLGFQPKDVILLSNLENVALTWSYKDFTTDKIKYTLGGPTTLRFFLGRYAE